MAFTGQIGQKANWANCFFQCVQGMLRIISIIYIIINIIYILYLLLTWKSRCAYMKMPNLLLPNLPILEDGMRHEGVGYSLLGSGTAVCGISVGEKAE